MSKKVPLWCGVILILTLLLFCINSTCANRRSSKVTEISRPRRRQDNRGNQKISHPRPIWTNPKSAFTFTSVSGSLVSIFPNHEDEIQPQNDIQDTKDFHNATFTRQLEKEKLLEELGVWDPPWSYAGHHNHHFQRDQSNLHEDDIAREDTISELEATLSKVKIIPNEHHVSAFLHRGVVKRFLLINDNFGNPLSITITPCTSIVLWVVRLWPVIENSNNSYLGPPQHIKTYRTQRAVTFTEPSASRGVYSLDIRPINWDSYVHLFASARSTDPSIVMFTNNQHSSHPSSPEERFHQHIFTHVDLHIVNHKEKNNNGGSKSKANKKSRREEMSSSPFPSLNFPIEEDQLNTIAERGNWNETFRGVTPSLSNKPRIWAQRLSGNRLHVKWDASPVNPHSMSYCLVVSTRRDYSSLCSAKGERFGVLPPDLMHVTYYSGVEKEETSESHLQRHKRRHHHGEQYNRRTSRSSSHGPGHKHKDIVIGCVNKKTHYILNNLQEGRLYYFNVFLKDLGTNVTYPYVRTTLKHYKRKKGSNILQDAKPTRVKLFEERNKGKPLSFTTMKFNLNKPCSELTLYVMPCGGGSIKFELSHNKNRTLYASDPVDSFDIIKIAMPQRGKYFLNISQAEGGNNGVENWSRLAEVYLGKKNRRLPLPRLPGIKTLFEDETKRACDSVTLKWWPSPDARDNEYCIFLKAEKRKRSFKFKNPNQCDVYRSLRNDPYVTHSLCVQKTSDSETGLLSQKIVGLHPATAYEVQLVLKRHNGKGLSYDLYAVQTLDKCSENK